MRSEIPEEWKNVKVDDLFYLDRQNIMPNLHPESYFVHFSIPAFDEKKEPEISLGKEIESNKYRIRHNSILLSKLNPRIKRLWLVKTGEEFSEYRAMVCSTEFIQLAPKKELDLLFYYYYMSLDVFYDMVKRNAEGTTNSRQRMKPEEILGFNILEPPMKEQQKISTILQTVDNAINNTKELIEKYRLMKQGLMQDLFDGNWGFKPLSSFATLKGRIGWRGYTTSDLVDEGPLAIGAGNISAENKLDLSDRVHISREKYEESPDIVVKHNYVLIVQRGSLGKVAIVDRHIGEATINPSMILVKEIKTNPYFIYYNLCANHIQKEIADNLAQTGVPMITQDQCKNFKIYSPPDPEKERIVTVLLSVDRKMDSEKSYLEKLVKIKGGLMQDLLAGKVRVTA